jgi:uncharacterized protein (DUF58 family)
LSAARPAIRGSGPAARGWLRELAARRLARNPTLARALGRGGRDQGPVVLNRDKVFILPTSAGVMFALFLLLMLLGSLNYNNNMGLGLTFLLGGVTLVSILHSYRNLAGLTVRPGRVEPVFAGETVQFRVCLANPDPRPRYSLTLHTAEGPPTEVDAPAGATTCAAVRRPTQRRGRLRPGKVNIATRFPLGLFRAWSYVDLDLVCIVYPRPGERRPLPQVPDAQTREGSGHAARGADDFLGLRPYRPGDSPRHLHWKALAREQEPQTKQFASPEGVRLWLRWEDLPGMDTEQRIALLTRWVVDADAAGLAYGLVLPDTRLDPQHGPAHRHRCLEALAVFGEPSEHPNGESAGAPRPAQPARERKTHAANA